MMRAGVLRAGLAMAGIFVFGLVAGGVAGAAWARKTAVPVPPNAHEFATRQLKRMTKDLELTTEQVDRIRPRMEKYTEQFRQVRRRSVADVTEIFLAMNAELEAELTAGQIVKHRANLEEQKLRAERDANRRRGPAGGGAPGEKPPPPPSDAPAPQPPPG